MEKKCRDSKYWRSEGVESVGVQGGVREEVKEVRVQEAGDMKYRKF